MIAVDTIGYISARVPGIRACTHFPHGANWLVYLLIRMRAACSRLAVVIEKASATIVKTS